MASKVAKVTKLPAFLRNIDTSTLARFQETAGIDMFQLSGHYRAVYFRDKGRSVLSYHPGFYHADEDERVLLLEDTRNRNSTTRILYVEDNGTLWNADISIVFKTVPDAKYNYGIGRYDDPTWTSPIVTSCLVSAMPDCSPNLSNAWSVSGTDKSRFSVRYAGLFSEP